MRRFRKIIVDNIEYKWLFRYDDYDYIKCPYLLIIMYSYPKTAKNIQFPIREHFLLNSGLPAIFQENKVLINLNRPIYVSQIINQCRKNGEQWNQPGYQYLNGLEILKQLKYQINLDL